MAEEQKCQNCGRKIPEDFKKKGACPYCGSSPIVNYKCFDCGRDVPLYLVRKRIRCPFCGCKMLFKTRKVSTKVKAR